MITLLLIRPILGRFCLSIKVSEHYAVEPQGEVPTPASAGTLSRVLMLRQEVLDWIFTLLCRVAALRSSIVYPGPQSYLSTDWHLSNTTH